jgi:hypothetical protein
MDFAEQLRKHRLANPVTRLKLSQFIRNKNVGAILVVEGKEDSQLYTYAFNTIVPNAKERIIICNGKVGVLKLRDFFESSFSRDKKTMFFIDKDHDDFVGLDYSKDGTYITDYYSIEWDVCTEQVLVALIGRHYTLSQNDPIRDIVNNKFQDLIQSWREHTKPIMQAVVVARRNGENNFDLDKIPLSSICRLKAGVFVPTDSDAKSLLSNAGCSSCPKSEELSQCATEFSSMDERLYIRGKLMLEFCCEFFRKLDEICINPKKIDGCDLETNVQIGKSNFVQFALNDWIIPDSLRDFLKNWTSREPT